MAAKFASAGARFWARQPHGALAAASLVACGAIGGARQSRQLRAEEGAKASADASDLKAYHLYSWQEGGTGWRISKDGLKERRVNKYVNPMADQLPGMNFLNPEERVKGHIIINDSKAASRSPVVKQGVVRANATRNIWWDPSDVRVAIVACGDLVPGMNSVIREITHCLWYQYGVRTIYGIESGFHGLSRPEDHKLVHLTEKSVRDIHMKGGCILKVGRGGFEPDLICENLKKQGVNIVFLIGGDGTHAAGDKLYATARDLDLPMSIIGIPKSIDNDVALLDKSFGFETAVAAATDVIHNGWVEATSCAKGVGIVKLLGEDSGFVVMHAALSSTIVDLCLIPEVKFRMEDLKDYVDATLASKDFMVITVAEGAGRHLTDKEPNADIGMLLKGELDAHLKASGGRTFYIEPSYILRSHPVNANDHIFCSRLARDAVHCAMRGYTGVSVGPINGTIGIIPMKCIAEQKTKVGIRSSNWQMCVQSCNMPHALAGMSPKKK